LIRGEMRENMEMSGQITRGDEEDPLSAIDWTQSQNKNAKEKRDSPTMANS
jgi:hypothetical protein